MENEIFNLERYGRNWEVKPVYDSYGCNGTLALKLMCRPEPEMEQYYASDPGFILDPYVEVYGIVTVNLPESEMLRTNVQFVDENNHEGIGRWLQENGIATPLDIAAHSGFCTYRAYEFNVSEKVLSNIRNAREDVIASRLITRIESSGMKPEESTPRGNRYHIAPGTDIVLYKGGTSRRLGEKPDVFLLADGKNTQDMWRLRNLPSAIRQNLAHEIINALSEAKRAGMRVK